MLLATGSKGQKESSSELTPSIFRISSGLPFFVRDLIISGMLSSPVVSLTPVSCVQEFSSGPCLVPRLLYHFR